MTAAHLDPNLAAWDFIAIPLSEPMSPVVKARKSCTRVLFGLMDGPKRGPGPNLPCALYSTLLFGKDLAEALENLAPRRASEWIARRDLEEGGPIAGIVRQGFVRYFQSAFSSGKLVLKV